MKLGFHKVRRPFHQMNIAHAKVRTCMPSGFGGCSETGNKPTAIDWANWCFGPPFTWSSRYWDGTPEMAHHFYAMTAKLIKQKYPGIQVGGPASGASPSFFPCGDMSPSSLGMTWIRDFLLNVKAQGAPLDFFSFHYYGQGQGQDSSGALGSLPDVYQSFVDVIALVGGFGDLPIAITEYNAPFALGNKSAFVGSIAGAATNAAKIAFWVTKPRMHAAFLYQGVSGAFEALNPYSWPLGCHAEVQRVQKSRRFWIVAKACFFYLQILMRIEIEHWQIGT